MKGVWVALNSPKENLCVSAPLRLDRVFLDDAPSDDRLLDVACAFGDDHEWRVAVIAFERGFLAIAHAAMDAQRIERAFVGDFGRVELRDAGIQVAAHARVLLARGIEREEPG